MRKKSDARGRVSVSIDWRSAPIKLLELKELCYEARLLMAWLFMHGNDWVFRVGYALLQLGISESTWLRKVRPQLISTGFFKQRRLKGEPGSPGFDWDNEFTDEPLRHLDSSGRLSCQFEGIQTECIQGESMQADRYTEAQSNKGCSKQKRESKKKQTPPSAALSKPSKSENQTPAPPGQPSSAPPGRMLAGDKEKEFADLAYAKRIGAEKGLSSDEIAAAIAGARWPSRAPAAVEAAAKAKAAAAAQAAKAAALATPPPLDPAAIAKGAALLGARPR